MSDYIYETDIKELNELRIKVGKLLNLDKITEAYENVETIKNRISKIIQDYDNYTN